MKANLPRPRTFRHAARLHNGAMLFREVDGPALVEYVPDDGSFTLCASPAIYLDHLAALQPAHGRDALVNVLCA